MPLLKRRTKRDAEIPSASMADIAFLLLIFFLVTTTINADKGIYMQLPPKLLEDNPPPEINQRNLLNVLVAADGQVLIDNEVTNVDAIRAIVKRHILNNGREPQLSISPDKAVTSFKTKRGLPYEIYIAVLDEIKSAYNDVRDDAARQEYGVTYGEYKARLDDEATDEIAERYPLKISLAEPDPD
ncbi:ExbD/TolR family protein [Rubrivirga sp. IMCC43871]|uniref:ExbD/TolR family protein n=1 Tax=Rubrivirga sp. IMCC43871 TaxID=3391575 RepID=UPI00398FA97E